jgi:hypothetical protein
MRRWIGVLTVVLLILAGVGIGVAAYHAGQDHGITQGLQEAGRGVKVVRVEDGRGYFPFGLFLFPLFFFGIFFLLRMAFWGGRWGRWRSYGPGGPGGPGGRWGEERHRMFEEWHRGQHEEAGSGAGSEREQARA